MDRRSFLKSSGVLVSVTGLSGTLAACGGGGGSIPDGPAQLNVTITSFEFLTGPERPVPFAVRTLDNVELRDADIQVYLRDPDGTVRGGPFETRYTEAPGTGLGLYVADLAIEEPGPVEIVAVEGARYGAAAVNAVAPEESEVPAPGVVAPVVATPTTDDERGYEKICTQDPQCGMHEVSLDEALEAGRPVMLLFATPEYCQTVVCGPAVEIVDDVRNDGDWGDTAWIHCEIYSEVGGSELVTGEPVRVWNLPSEPWLFAVDADGGIASRLDGPMLPDMVSQMAEGLAGA
jgi:hypothetical protein